MKSNLNLKQNHNKRGPDQPPNNEGAPRTQNPRRSGSPTDVEKPGSTPQIRGADLSAHPEGEESVVRHAGHARIRADRWTEEETSTLVHLCRRYDGGRVMWNEVKAEFERSHRSRTKGALQAKWKCVKSLTHSRTNTPCRLDQSQAAPSAESAIINTPQVLPVTEEENSEQRECSFSEDPQYWAFRRAFYGYFRWAVNGFDREPLKRVGRNCPKKLFAYADSLVGSAFAAFGPNQSEIGRLNGLVYAAGRTIYQFWKDEVSRSKQGERNWFRTAAKEQKEIDGLIRKIEHELKRRKEKRPPSKRERQIIKTLVITLGTRSTKELEKRLEQQRQRLMLLNTRISLREQEKRRKSLRTRFKNTPSLKILPEDAKGNKPEGPSMQSILDFWKPIIGRKVESKPDDVEILRRWKDEQRRNYQERERVGSPELEEAFSEAVRKMRPWKAVGPDGIHAFWWKSLPTAKKLLGQLTVKWLETGKITGGWLCRGRTVLIAKKGDLSKPENYRPITCLNTCYKLVTAVMNTVIIKHLEKGNAIASNQRALRPREWGCTHALLLDKAVITDAMSQRQSPISVAWVDYRKAFDSVSHDYLRWVLEAVGIPKAIGLALSRLMKDWQTRFEVSMAGSKKGNVKSQRMDVLNGIFQGDSLSPTLFILCVSPISYALNQTVTPCISSSGWSAGYGFKLGHQFYVDDLKLYARSPAQLEGLLAIVSETSKVMGLQLNRSKCAVTHYDPALGPAPTITQCGEDIEQGGIPLLGFRCTYKYLGIEQRLLNDPGTLDNVEAKFLEAAKTIFSSNLSWCQMATAYNTIAIAGLRHVYANSNAGASKLQAALARARALDTKVRSILKVCKVRFKASCAERLYVGRDEGGYGLSSAEEALEDSIVATWCYLATNPDLAPQHHFFQKLTKRGKRTPEGDALKIMATYGIKPVTDVRLRKVTVNELDFNNASQLHQHLRDAFQKKRAEKHLNGWKEKAMAGRILRDATIDRYLSTLWIKKGCISGRNLRDVLAVQENTLLARASPTAQGGNQSNTCRCCHAAPETVQHITNACTHWLPNLYVERHDAVARNLYYSLCTRYGLPPTHYSNQVPSVLENEHCKILWDTELQTKAKMKHRKPDIVVFDKDEGRISVFEVSVAFATGMDKQREIKINRYTVNSTELPDELNPPYPPGTNLIGDLQAVYKQRVDFVPVIVGSCGEYLSVVKEDLKRTLKMRSEALDLLLERMARSAVLGTARIVRAHMACP